MMPLILLTGPPGVGKTTAILSVLGKMKSQQEGEGVTGLNAPSTAGFFTRELRENVDHGNPRRTGFEIVDIITGDVCKLASVSPEGSRDRGPKVGRYTVNVRGFETLAIKSLTSGAEGANQVLIIDEIGKMELLSNRFCKRLNEILACATNQENLLVVGTVAQKGAGLIARSKEMATELVTLSPETRDDVPDIVFGHIKTWCTTK
eukprot:m.59341 g.59341  ORF g.59341 m.59341 type:complete len:205 (-) comp11240_c0_seq2:69-683(-)